MSKKSRRRNKKILAALALAGGAAMLAKGRGKGAVSTAGQPIGVDRIDAPKVPYITKKSDVLPEPKVVVPPVHGGGGIHHGKPKTLYLEKRARAHLPKGPPGWDNPYRAPRVHSIRGMKKGGKAKKQGYTARKDESIAMRIKRKRTPAQLKASRDESYGKWGSGKGKGKINK